ncbi:hypothetical protein JHK82_048503 [Glycine max]|nr:hypothetical protein JHK86_048357 [Glycine max]KAG4944349.1 hypothetical protein JHK85_048995 [Glycine max]KAG5098649.1 hypothetical protein JHK82_048503 [Glycine max]KAG5103419.1 hypothetical protein JHK84_048388 [Glycine max]
MNIFPGTASTLKTYELVPNGSVKDRGLIQRKRIKPVLWSGMCINGSKDNGLKLREETRGACITISVTLARDPSHSLPIKKLSAPISPRHMCQFNSE